MVSAWVTCRRRGSSRASACGSRREAATEQPNTVPLPPDAAALELAAGKVLARDWASDNDGLHRQAREKLEAAARDLTEQGRKAEADRLLAALQRLRERDLVIQISWEPGASGPAEYELEVKEPTGGVCSSRFRVTPGGGTLLGGDLKQPGRLAYVASRAFSGEYRVTVRRLWGRPLGGSNGKPPANPVPKEKPKGSK